MAPQKYALFDMDNTLLRGRFIDSIAEEYHFSKNLSHLRRTVTDPLQRTREIAALLSGLKAENLLDIVQRIPLVADAAFVIEELKHLGYRICIVSDSYDLVVSYIGQCIGADLCFSNHLEIKGGLVTGKVTVPDYFQKHDSSFCDHPICKGHLLAKFQREQGILRENILAVGDSENDICMLKYSGIGISFCSHVTELDRVASHQIKEPSFAKILKIVGGEEI